MQLGNVSPEQAVPEHIVKPDYYYELEPQNKAPLDRTEIKDENAIAHMRASCKLASTILRMCGDIVKVFITSSYIQEAKGHCALYCRLAQPPTM